VPAGPGRGQIRVIRHSARTWTGSITSRPRLPCASGRLFTDRAAPSGPCPKS
jgi:hypothetical protein